MQYTGLYGILSLSENAKGVFLCTQNLVQQAQAAINGGARILQLRDKSTDMRLKLARAEAILALCKLNHIPLLINDDVALAKAIHADGVHLGQTDMPIHDARLALGPHAIIGITCHNQLTLAIQAANEGAQYIALGACYPSLSKSTTLITPHEITLVRKQIALPIVAIGGITPENGKVLLGAGADMLAAIHGLFAQDNIENAARRYSALFNES